MTEVLAVSITPAGRRLASRLPYEHVHGRLADTVRARWGQVDGFVLFAATGAVVRTIAPLLGDKRTDPAVVCVDEAGRYAIALTGGHAGGANDLARAVAGVIGAEAVITTATDAAGAPALDQLPGLEAEGDVAGVGGALLAGRWPVVDNPLGWPLAPALTGHPEVGPERIVVSDLADPAPDGPLPAAGVVVLRPPSLVAGVGTSSDTTPDEVAALVQGALADAGLAPASLALVATIDRRRDHPAVTGLGLPVRAFTSGTLAGATVPTPSETVRRAVGTPSVCEAAALLAAGPEAQLVVTKRTTGRATVAVARRRRPEGRVTLVGLGPGDPLHRTPAAERAVRRADVVIGYGAYVDQCAGILRPGHQVERSPLGAEVDRARRALDLAVGGSHVAMVCSGDAGIYAMASPVLELAGEPGYEAVEVEVVPGVTAGLAAAAVLGAPLGHDHVLLSLSDLLTPWEHIEERVRAAADADLVVVAYNPRSERRTWQLGKALAILAEARPPSTPVGVVTDAGRPGQRAEWTTLDRVDPETVTMTSCVIVGSSATVVANGRMVTPRGYRR